MEKATEQNKPIREGIHLDYSTSLPVFVDVWWRGDFA